MLPNYFKVELARENYERYYENIEDDLCQQWAEALVNHFQDVNGRQGFFLSFAGPVKVQIITRIDTPISHLKIACNHHISERRKNTAPAAYVDIYTGSLHNRPRRMFLNNDRITMGRSRKSDITLPNCAGVSHEHAYILIENGQYVLYDGSWNSSRASSNGTFVEQQRIDQQHYAEGYTLRHGERIVLGASNPDSPTPGDQGTATLHFLEKQS